MQEILNDAGLQKGVNLALQSLNEDTLKSINRRNVSNATYKDLQGMFTQRGISTFTDIIIGLPNETYDTFTDGVSKAIESGQHNRIQFINLTLLENTTMSEPDYQKKYGFLVNESKVIQHHTSIEDESRVSEVQKLVIGNDTMPKEDWIKSKVFSWMTSLLYFDKLLQIPFIAINKSCSVNYKNLIEAFMKKSNKYNKISEILEFFTKSAVYVQNGGCEYIASKEWLNIWWPVNEYIFTKLCIEEGLADFL